MALNIQSVDLFACLQVEGIDKGGTFLGTMFLQHLKPSANVGVSLLSQGLAKLHPSFAASRVPGGLELLDAQESAKSKGLKVSFGFAPRVSDLPESRRRDISASR